MALLDARQLAEPSPIARRITRSLGISSIAVCLTYIMALVVLIVPWGNHPELTFNWEEYTAAGLFRWQHESLWESFDLDSGLMTTSGDSPLILLPAEMGMRILGREIGPIRLSTLILATLAVPLTWQIASDLAEKRAAWLAAILLAVSPAFLLYARTATTVGVTLAIATATILLLVRVTKNPRDISALALLQITFVLAAWGYSPVRTLWLLALGLMVIEFVLRPKDRRAFLIAFLVTLVALPGFLSIARQEQPLAAIDWYYFSQGEQLLGLRDNPDRLRLFMGTAADPARDTTASGNELFVRKLIQNVRDLGALLIDWKTEPALSDYWNPSGRLYPFVLVPFFMIGLVGLVRTALRRPTSRLMLILLGGLTVPIVLTTNVHIGRLIFALPVILIISALGLIATIDWIRPRIRTQRTGQLAAGGLVAIIVLATVGLAWRDQQATPQQQYGWSAIPTIKETAQTARSAGRPVVYLSAQSWDVIVVRAGLYWLALGDELTVVNLHLNITDDPGGSRTPFYVGDFLRSPNEWTRLPDRCNSVFVVPVGDLPAVSAQQTTLWAECQSLPQIVPVTE